MTTALCVGKWWLFDSTNPADHLEARELCAVCPMRPECVRTVASIRRDPTGRSSLEGTWAGHLYGATARQRLRFEETMFTDDEAREAHNAFTMAHPSQRTRSGIGDRIIIGERVYQRRVKRARKERRAS